MVGGGAETRARASPPEGPTETGSGFGTVPLRGHCGPAIDLGPEGRVVDPQMEGVEAIHDLAHERAHLVVVRSEKTPDHGIRFPSASTTMTSLPSPAWETGAGPACKSSSCVLRTQATAITLASWAAIRSSSSGSMTKAYAAGCVPLPELIAMPQKLSVTDLGAPRPTRAEEMEDADGEVNRRAERRAPVGGLLAEV